MRQISPSPTAGLFDRVVAVNLRSTYLVTRGQLGRTSHDNAGRVVSTTSNSGLLGTAGSSAYAAGEGGRVGSDPEPCARGAIVIYVNAIAAMAYTPMSMTSWVAPPSWRTGEGDEWAQRLDPTLVAPVVAWLSHEQCTLNGQVLSVAGGRVARFVMGLTDGFVDDALSIESVRDHEAILFSADDVAAELPLPGRRGQAAPTTAPRDVNMDRRVTGSSVSAASVRGSDLLQPLPTEAT